jgi:hypothetical protein
MKRALLALSLLAAVGCGPSMIPGTQVEDTPENREIADLIEKYRLAVEHRDVAALKELISRRYFSNSGTTSESSDDFGYERIEAKILPSLRDSIKSVQFSIILRRVELHPERALAEFEYFYKFFYVDAGKDRWSSKNDFARIEFTKEDGVWRIVSGL